MADDKQTREQRIQGDTSLAKQAAHDFGGSPSQPMVDAESAPLVVVAKVTIPKGKLRPGKVVGTLVVDSRSGISFDLISCNLTISPTTACAVVQHPFVAGPMSPALRLDAGEVISLPVEWTIHCPGTFALGAIVRLRERGADSSTPLEYIPADPALVVIEPVI